MHTTVSVDWDTPGVRAKKEVLPKTNKLIESMSVRRSPKVMEVTTRDWLTPAQLELVRLLSTGLSFKEIATLQNRSEGTLKVYAAQARARSGCKTTPQMTAEYVRRVECPAPSVTPTTNS